MSTTGPSTIGDLLRRRAERNPSQFALLAPEREALTNAGLLEVVEGVARSLAGIGIGPGDRVAMVLPNGPELAAAFLATSCVATAAPLNPAYRQPEFEFFLSDLDANALIVPDEPGAIQTGVSASTAVAARLQIPVLPLLRDPGAAAGQFTLVTGDRTSVDPRWANPGDPALVLHTSGTTARPKIVPLAHKNLCASAANIAAWLALGETDRSLNVMPLFHIHGLVGVLLSSMTAGGSVICSPGFVATEFFDWATTLQATWYSAVPTMHQAIAARARSGDTPVTRLRLVRSSSSALAPATAKALQDLLGVPVIEAYGMTEASHQMTSNPLPPRTQKLGSVGLPGPGTQVGIRVADDVVSTPHARGEILVRGPGVFSGYALHDDPTLNERAFYRGWFCTGDEGYLDDDGYLFITGRIKELINRGGEKISPREIDEVLLEHPAVAQAVAFAVPDARLGEDVGVAIVLRGRATPMELQEFAATRLADFKVPRVVRIVDRIPLGPTGKLRRIGLAEMLGDAPAPTADASDSGDGMPGLVEIETLVARLWCDVLRVPSVGPNDAFIAAGGDSIMAAVLLARLQETLGVQWPLVAFFGELATVRAQALWIATTPPDAPDAVFERKLLQVESLSPEQCKEILTSAGQAASPGK